MRARDGYPPGVPCFVDTVHPDPAAATDFYGGLFGWEFEDRMPPELPGHYFGAQLEGLDVAGIGSLPEGAPRLAKWNTYIWVQSADDTAAKVKHAGGQMLVAPTDVFAAGRLAVFADPSGAVFSVWQPNEHRGAQLVNAPGTWNWSNLNTRDIEGAKAFYGAVFGWEADTIDLGDKGSFTMVRSPGYADELEKLEPGIRERQASQGAPPGFAEAIAWMQPIADEDTPAHWSVTFSVDDADAAAARAVELGGEVVVEPFEAPPVRIAVLRDPQGAVFAVNRYDPG